MIPEKHIFYESTTRNYLLLGRSECRKHKQTVCVKLAAFNLSYAQQGCQKHNFEWIKKLGTLE